MKASGGDGRREGDVAECDGKKLRQCKKKKRQKFQSIVLYIHGCSAEWDSIRYAVGNFFRFLLLYS